MNFTRSKILEIFYFAVNSCMKKYKKGKAPLVSKRTNFYVKIRVYFQESSKLVLALLSVRLENVCISTDTPKPSRHTRSLYTNPTLPVRWLPVSYYQPPCKLSNSIDNHLYTNKICKKIAPTLIRMYNFD